MYGGPEQPNFAKTVQAVTGIKLLPDINGGDSNCVSFTPVVRCIITPNCKHSTSENLYDIVPQLARWGPSIICCNCVSFTRRRPAEKLADLGQQPGSFIVACRYLPSLTRFHRSRRSYSLTVALPRTGQPVSNTAHQTVLVTLPMLGGK